MLLIAIAIGTIIIVPLWAFKYFQVVGPIIGALISIIAVLGNEAARYCSSTSNLRLSLGLESERDDSVKDPGLDVEAFDFQPQPNYRIWAYRVSAMVINDGKAIIRDVKASLTIKVRECNQGDKPHNCQETYYLGKVLDLTHCGGFLVNRYNPHVIGETLAWALPEKIIPRPNISYQTMGKRKIENLIKNLDSLDNLLNDVSVGFSDKVMLSIVRVLLDTFKDGLPIPWLITDYQHITSISPGQRNRLLIFSYVRLSDNEYLMMPFSEYGAPGPYRACLRLDRDHEFILDVTVHGEGARSPLKFSLCVDFNKLAELEETVSNLESAVKQGRDVEQAFNNMLKALNGLRCSGAQSRTQRITG